MHLPFSPSQASLFALYVAYGLDIFTTVRGLQLFSASIPEP
jgi:hypothetical protein